MKKNSIGYLLVAICSRRWSLTLLSTIIALSVGFARHWGGGSFSATLIFAYSIWGVAVGVIVSFADLSPHNKLLGVVFPPLVMVGAAVLNGLVLGWDVQLILMVALGSGVLGLVIKKMPALFNL